jgi:hypothetical protein
MRFDPEAIPAALANRVLARESWARSSLAAHAGRTFTVAVGPIATTMRIEASGAIEPAPSSSATPDLKLTLSPLTLPSFLADPTRWDALVRVDGDAALAATGVSRNHLVRRAGVGALDQSSQRRRRAKAAGLPRLREQTGRRERGELPRDEAPLRHQRRGAFVQR